VMRTGILIALACMLAACASSPPPSYYTLASLADATAPEPAASYRVAVGPVTLPELVDRPHLVLRTGANQVVIAEQHRWAEPLRRELPRVVAANLARELGAWVGDARESTSQGADYRVAMDIRRFDSTLGDSITIEALWVIQGNGSAVPYRGYSLVREPAGGGYDGLVAAHDRALGVMSREIASALKAYAARH
jgi:uncharacterized lipoprotein YmbA